MDRPSRPSLFPVSLAKSLPHSVQALQLNLRWPKTFFVVVAVAFISSAAQDMRPLSSALAKSITASGRKTVAVIDFTDLQGNVIELGRFLAEELSIDLLADAKGFEVIDRTQPEVDPSRAQACNYRFDRSPDRQKAGADCRCRHACDWYRYPAR